QAGHDVEQPADVPVPAAAHGEDSPCPPAFAAAIQSRHGSDGSPRAMNAPLSRVWRWLYLNGRPRGSTSSPPAPSRIACPAAVSHSLVGPKRGYTSSLPSASQQNLSEEPSATGSITPRRSIKAPVRASRCERLAATRSGRPGVVRPVRKGRSLV